MKLTKIFLFIITLLSIRTLTLIADEIELAASVDKTVLTTADSINLTITVSGSTVTAQPQLPKLDGFNLIFGPSVSTRTSIVNGVVSVSKGFSYVLKPLSAGKFTIGAFTLQHNGNLFKSNIINVEVLDKTDNTRLKQSSDKIDLSKMVFVEFTADKNEVYTYEQIILTFKLFYQKGLPVTDLEYAESDTRNFIKESMGKQKHYEVIRNGIIYNVIELKTALFPVTSGELKIMPAKVDCSLIVRSRRRALNDFFGDSLFDDFFGQGQKRYPISRETDAITIFAKSLPVEGKPQDFNGAVGDYTLSVEAKPTNAKVGDPITLTMKIEGAGNIQTISEPILLDFNENKFKSYPAESKTTVMSRKNGIKGNRTFKKVIEPQSADIAQTPGISFSFFNPELGEYKTIVHDHIPVKVEAGEIESPIRLYVRETAKNNKDQISIITKDILPIMANLDSFSNQQSFFYKSNNIFAILFVPIVAVVASIFAQKHRRKLKTDVSYARNKKAQTESLKRLNEIKRFMEKISTEECYSDLSNTIAEYIANKLNTTSASISSNSVSNILETRNIKRETIDQLVELLNLCDYSRFAKDSSTKKMLVDAINSTENLINSLEKQMR